MKTTMIVYTMLSLFIMGSVVAQNNQQDRPRGQRNECRTSIPNLTEDQKEKIEIIHESFSERMQEIRNDESLSKDDRWAAMEKLQEEKTMAFSEILTAEQFEVFEKNHEQLSRGRMNRRDIDRGPNQELRKEVLEKRKEFELQLSREEKQIIADVREELKVKRMDRRAQRGTCDQQSRPQKRDGMEEMKTICQPVEVIAEYHKDALSEIAEELKELHPGKRNGNDRGRGKQRHSMQNEDHRTIRFLLLDPTKDIGSNDLMIEETDFIKLFPNPVKSNLTINFELQQRDNVSIELLNKQGEVLRVVDVAMRDAGGQSLNLDVSDLDNGSIYYIRISMTKETAVEKFIKL